MTKLVYCLYVVMMCCLAGCGRGNANSPTIGPMKQTTSELLIALNSTNGQAVADAIHELAERRTTEAIPGLISLVEDQREIHVGNTEISTVGLSAWGALRHITAESLPQNTNSWQEWHEK